MAYQVANFISGKMHNVIFYQQHGQWIVRSMPEKVRQSAITKKRNQNFGIAAALGRTLRQQLGNGIPFPKDKLMQSRFSGAIIKWLGKNDISSLPAQNNLPYISGFSFNEAASLSSRCKMQFAISRVNNSELLLQLPVVIPTQAFATPAGTAAIELVITATACSLQQPDSTANKASMVVRFDNNDTPVAAQSITLPVASAEGFLLLTVASMRCLNSAGQLIDKINYMAAAVVDARYL